MKVYIIYGDYKEYDTEIGGTNIYKWTFIYFFRFVSRFLKSFRIKNQGEPP